MQPKQILLFLAILSFVITGDANGQTAAPYITNVAGGSYHTDTSYAQYEWSVGELAVIETYTSANIIITNGVLQPCTDKTLIAGFGKTSK